MSNESFYAFADLMKSRIDFIYAGGAVKRYHVMDTLRQQTNAEHSFGVAWLVYLLTDRRPSIGLLMAALSHDLPEQVTGDLPAPAKRALGISEQFAAYEEQILDAAAMIAYPITAFEERVLKLADTAELCLYCIKELGMGNRQMDAVYQRGMGYIAEMDALWPTARELVHVLEEKYRECQQ